MVGAKHPHTGAKFRTPERNHVLPDVSCHYLAVLRGSVVENPLNEIVAILIAGDIDQGNASAVSASFTNAVQVATKKIRPSDFETLLDHFGCKLVGAVLGRISNNMVHSAASVGGSTVFTNMLDAPVAELAVGHNINIGQNFFDTWSLSPLSAT